MKSLTFIAIFAILLSTCSVEIELAPCMSSNNCPKNQYCSKIDNRCHYTRFKTYSCENSGCAENEFCYPLDKSCHLVDEVGLSCETHSDCPPGQLCTKDKTCIPPEQPQCSEDRDCIKENVSTARCVSGVCIIDRCNLGFRDKDIDYSNGCEEMLSCSNEGLNPYEQCTGNNVCKCDSDCIILSNYYGIKYDKGLCLKRCSPTDSNKIISNELCNCTLSEVGICKRANLFQIAPLKGQVRAKLLDKCDNFMNESTELKDEISITLGNHTSSYNRCSACEKMENGKPIIQLSLFKICGILPCEDIISITLPKDVRSKQRLDTKESGAIKAKIKYDISNSDTGNNIIIKEIWINAISGKGNIQVNNNGSDSTRMIDLYLDLIMVRYDIPICGDIVEKACEKL
ncbi:MAG: hypothetical protein N2746_12230 [Deltaproteobacteria bacterium]|nr:hypothetical protein [Deltaproteobacteria bacterium]